LDLRKDGLDVDVDERSGFITLVRGDQGELTAKVYRLVADRKAARTRKDWAESDRIRDELAAMGIVLKDSKDGTTWEVKR
jgi:cysteinyl-tRNA synthetase